MTLEARLRWEFWRGWCFGAGFALLASGIIRLLAHV